MTIVRSLSLLQYIRKQNGLQRFYSSTKLRNIGILAHIDAGKTTTTERMLFYSGKTRTLGEVHRGNTVTDYLAQERERGITICSSAVAFKWQEHKINLLDTPGHIDFTMEVEQSLHAVDGVVVVMDGTAGVEAQTVTVWSQAEKHSLPKLAYINKMDRPDADFTDCVNDLKQKLGAIPICLQAPLKNENGSLCIFDVLTEKVLTWNNATMGREYSTKRPTDEHIKELKEKRYALIDELSGIDDELAQVVISNESFEQVSNEMIQQALRRSVAKNKVVPVLLGSAYKNIGIQPLMDAVIHYLPAPHERNHLYDCFGADFVGKVFKIIHDKQRGPLTLVRVLRGELKKGSRLVNNRNNAEVVTKVYEPLADEYREINDVQAGDVAICSGLKHTITGDLLTTSASSLKNAQKRLEQTLKVPKSAADTENSDSADVSLVSEIFAIEPQIPDAVYFCSIEPPSLGAQAAMETALKQLQREDPSLRVNYDAVTGQTVLGGMGELHMDIVKSRILTEYKIDVDLGPLQIAYKETIDTSAMETFEIEKEIAGSKQSVKITLELLRDQNEPFSLDKSGENASNLNLIRPRMLNVIRKGALAALERGPRVGGQVVETQIRLHNITIGRGTADSFIMAAAAQCVQKVLTLAGTRLLEPIMAIEIVAPSERVTTIIADLSRRRAIVNKVRPKSEQNKIISVNAPLAELSGYSSVLRAISSGTASMTMQPCGFSNMNANDEERAIQKAQGFE